MFLVLAGVKLDLSRNMKLILNHVNSIVRRSLKITSKFSLEVAKNQLLKYLVSNFILYRVIGRVNNSILILHLNQISCFTDTVQPLSASMGHLHALR